MSCGCVIFPTSCGCVIFPMSCGCVTFPTSWGCVTFPMSCVIFPMSCGCVTFPTSCVTFPMSCGCVTSTSCACVIFPMSCGGVICTVSCGCVLPDYGFWFCLRFVTWYTPIQLTFLLIHTKTALSNHSDFNCIQLMAFLTFVTPQKKHQQRTDPTSDQRWWTDTAAAFRSYCLIMSRF